MYLGSHQIHLIQDIEKIQRRAARWVLSGNTPYSSVTGMLKLLELPTLETRRHLSRLSQFHKIVAIYANLVQLYKFHPDNTVSNYRHLHQYRIIFTATRTTAYQQIKATFQRPLKNETAYPTTCMRLAQRNTS